MKRDELITLKKALVEQCKVQLENKRLQLRQGMQELEEAMEEDSNNSSADQFESTRSMYQLDRDRMGQQLQEVLQQQRMFHQNESSPETNEKARIRPGHLITTKNAFFFMNIPLGKVAVNDKIVFVISAVSPLGQEFLDKVAGDTVVFNGQSHEVVAVV